MKKRRMRLAALLMAAMMLCGLAVAEPVHEHQWSAWQKSADHPSQETRTCLECSAVETREHEWGAWIDQGDGTEKHICKNCQKEEIRKIETPLEPLGDDVGDEGGGASLLKGDGTGTDPNAGTDIENLGEDPDEGPIVKQAQIQINLVVDSSEAKAGDTLTYTATVNGQLHTAGRTPNCRNVLRRSPGRIHACAAATGRGGHRLAQGKGAGECRSWYKADGYGFG